MARAATSTELNHLRADHQRSLVYLAVYKPAVVYSARVNQVSFTNPLAEISFDAGVGTLGDILPGMTVLVGTSAGGMEKGTCHIRKAAAAGILSIGATAEIAWADNDHLTVLDDFEIRAKPARQNAEQLLIDWDIPYSDQNLNFAPFPVMGAHTGIKLTGASVEHRPDGSASWVIGSTISGYSWSAPGASLTSGMTTAAPVITYNLPGWYRVGLTVTAANGKSATGYRRVYIWNDANPPIRSLIVERCAGDYDAGGWECALELIDEAGQTDIRDGGLALLISEDWHGGARISLGELAGYESVIFSGRIDGESIESDGQSGRARFVMVGAQEWLRKINGSPANFSASDGAPATWQQFQSPTVDKALQHLLHWRTNASQVMDIRLSGDTRRLPDIELPMDSVWSQIEQAAERRMLARACCDRYDRLYVEIPSQIMNNRAGIPVVMGLTKDDWTGKINIERRRAQVGMVEVSGTRDDTPDLVLMSRAPGGIPKREGRIERLDGLVFDNQEHANSLSGLVLAHANNEYPYIDIELAGNNRMMDICPNQYVSLDIAAADNPRGITWSGKRIIPRRIEIEHDSLSGRMWTRLECEGETSGAAGVTEIPPPPGGDINLPPLDIEMPGFPILPPPSTWMPPIVPPPVPPGGQTDCLLGTEITGPYGVIPDSLTLNSEDEARLRTSVYLPATLRPGNVTHRSMLVWRGVMERKLAGIWQQVWEPYSYMVRAIDGSQNVILTGQNAYGIPPGFGIGGLPHFYSIFQPVGALDINGFRIEINPTRINDQVSWEWNFDAGPQGWTNEHAQYPEHCFWADGRLNARGTTLPGIWAEQHWYYYPPGEVYQVGGGGSVVEFFGQESAGFALMHIKWRNVLAMDGFTIDGGPTLYTWNLTGAIPNQPIEFIRFSNTIHSTHYPNVNWISWLRLRNFIGLVEAYRISFYSIEVYNVCPQA